MTEKEIKAGLILEGGGMRGVFTAGVLDFFLDAHITFDICIGVSAGSCHACSYLSGQKERGYHTVADYIEDPKYCSGRNWLKTGDYFGAEMAYKTIPDELLPFDYEAYEKNPAKFYAVVTNCITGEAEYKPIVDLHRDIRYIRASSSLPLLSRTVWIQKKPYLDGGIADSIPIKKSVELGNKKNVVVLTQCREYRKKKNDLMPLLKLRYGKEFPKLVQRMKERHLNYNQTLEYLYEEEKKGNVFLIMPPGPVEIGRIEKNKEKLEQLYRQGYETAKEQAEELKKYMDRPKFDSTRKSKD